MSFKLDDPRRVALRRRPLETLQKRASSRIFEMFIRLSFKAVLRYSLGPLGLCEMIKI